jgi:hypothetical protein
MRKTGGSAIALLNYNDSVKLNLNASSAGAGYVGMVTNHPLIFVSNDTERVRIDTNGNLGIGTSSPGYKLDVTGEIRQTGNNFWFSSARIAGDGSGNIDINYNNGSSPSFTWYNGGTSALARITSTGNMGIGTTSPADKLHVIGNIRINGGDILNWGGQAFIQTLGAYDMFFRPNSTLQMILTAAGNVGIGQGFTSPSAKLHVSSSVSAVSAIFNGSVGIGTTTPVSRLDIIGTNGSFPATSGATQTTGSILRLRNGNSNLVLDIGGNGGNGNWLQSTNRSDLSLNYPILLNPNGGNVGIGTTNPGAKLQVDVSSATGIRINGTGGYANIISQGGHLEFYKDSTPTYAAAIGLSTPATALSNDIQFATYNGSSWSARMTLQNGGNVGIGTTSPAAFLNIVGNGTHTILRNTSATSYTTLRLFNDQNSALRALEIDYSGASYSGALITSGPSGESACVTTTGAYPLAFGTNNTARMTILSNGSIGIGTNSPTSILDVRSQINLTNSSNNSMLGIYGTAFGYSTSYLVVQIGASSGNNTVSIGYDPSVNSSGAFTGNGNEIITRNGVRFIQPNGTTNWYLSTLTMVSGSVGIGTLAPSQRLEVQGNGQFGNDSVTSIGLKLTRLTGGMRTSEHTFHSSLNSPWYTYGQNLTWTGELAGTVESTQAYRPYFEGFAPAGGYKIFGFMNVSSGAFTSTNVVNALTLTNTGNVGIGTTAPDMFARGYNRILGISGSTAAIQINASSGNAAYLDMGVAGTRIGSLYTDASVFEIGTPGAKPLYFFTNGSYKMTINSAGNVGIGTTSPSGILDVYGATSIFRYDTAGAASLYLRNWTSGGTAQMIFGVASGDDQSTTLSFASNIFSITNYGDPGSSIQFGTRNSTTSDIRLTINQDGNVGIGATNPTAKLVVSGSVAISGSISVDAFLGKSFALTGTSGSTAIYDTFATNGTGEVYELMATGNPNSAGSGNYKDVMFGKIFIGTGWNGSATTTYINYVQENPDPRSLYASGLVTSLSASIFFKSGSSEVTSKPATQNTKIRVKIGSYNSGYVGNYTTVRVKRLL